MKALEKYTRKRFKRLDALLKAFPGKDVKSSNHKIRLEIKRIKALLGLIHFNNKKFKDHTHYIPFRNIFRAAGKLREAGLQQELIEQYTRSHTPFYHSPAKGVGKLKKAIPQLAKALVKHEKIILKEIAEIRRWLYNTHLQNKKYDLLKKLSTRYSIADLHKIRKQLKELIYLTSIDKQQHIDPLLISMAELIGNWHDKILLLEYLKADESTSPQTLQAIKLETSNDLKQLKQLAKEYILNNRPHSHTKSEKIANSN